MSSLLRSTKFVRYFTGAARTLILNSAKTAETNPLINPKAFCASNNLLLRDYATKKSESLEPLLQKLDSEVRRFGRISKRDIDEVFDEIKAKNDITSSQSLLVIRCCGELVPEELPEQRTLLVQKIWSVLTERGIPMDISHYNALLRVYIENEHPFSPAKFLEELESKGLQPNRVTYQRLMWRYCQEGDVEGATKVLERMRELNHPVSEPVLNALVMGHAFHGDTEGARAVLQTMAGAGLEPTNRTYTLLACGFARNGDIENVEKTIQMAAEKDALVTDRDVLEIIESMALGGHSDKMESLYPHLHKSVGYNQEVCGVILRLLNKGQIETAKKLMKTMPSSNVNETAFKGAFFIKHVLKLKKTAEEIIKICQELKDEELVPNAFYIATEGALQQGRNDLSQKLFKELQKDGYEIRQHYYWPLLIKRGKERDEEGLLQILRDMNNENLTPSGETLRDYVIPFLLKNEKNPQNVILKLQIAGIPTIHSARNLVLTLLESAKTKMAAEIATQYRLRGQYNLIARPLINALNRTKDIDSFVRILHVTSTVYPQINEEASNEESQSDDKYDSAEVGRIIYSSIRNLKSQELRENLLSAAHSKGLAIDVSSAEAIEQYLGQNMTTKISELLTKLTSKDLELAPLEASKHVASTRSTAQLEKLITQVKAGGSNQNVNRLQKQLLEAYIKDGDVNKMNSYLDELKSKDFEINTSTLSQLFEFYVERDEIEKAEEIRSQILAKNPDYLLNSHKLVMMAHALVKANRYDDAVKYLKENKSFEETNSSFLVNSKSWQLLNSLAEAKETDKVKQMTSLLIESSYIEPSNVLLGPSIKVHLMNDDIDGALAEFEHCCGQYRSTPWKGELMKALILKEDAGKLQWLADLSTQIHGEVNILHDLVLAFVECGRLRQARRILATPGLTARAARLRDACQRYQQDGKPEFLEGLLEATKELSHIDRSNIFYHLLVTYCKADETDKALGLWTVLQEEGEIPTTEFLLTLGNHLKLNKREIPFVMPEDPEQPKYEPKTPETKPQQTKDQLTKNQATEKIETLIKNGNVDKALDFAISAIKQGVNPKPSVMKYLLKELALIGKSEKIQQLGGYINEDMKKDITYDDKLTLAVFNSGAGSQHIDKLISAVQEANSEAEFSEALRKFPRSSALATVLSDPEMTEKCLKIVDIAASKNNTTPANLIWMEFLLADKKTEAEKLWSKYLVDSTSIIFRRLLQEAYLTDKPEIMVDLISTLKTNKHTTHGCLGNAYSRLINYYLGKEKCDEAFEAYESAKESGLEKEHFNKICIKRLQEKAEGTGRKLTV